MKHLSRAAVYGFILVAVLAAAGYAPAPAYAHGLVGRADLPLPGWLMAWAAVVVLVVSFLALASFWSKPKLMGKSRQLVDLGPLLPIIRALAMALGMVLFVGGLLSGFFGEQEATFNILPTLVYVMLWVGMVPLSLLLGNVFAFINPWRTLGHMAEWMLAPFRGKVRSTYPSALGYYPAVIGLALFLVMELVWANGSEPRNIAICALLYTLVQIIGCVRYGTETWIYHGETFGVYFRLVSLLSIWERKGSCIHIRPPLAGVITQVAPPGMVALVITLIASTSLDGASEGEVWQSMASPLSDLWRDFGLSAEMATSLSFLIGLISLTLIMAGLYALATWKIAGDSRMEIRRIFIGSLLPIAVVYVLAHYLSFLLFQGQAFWFQISDPAVQGWDIFGTASNVINYGFISATTIWYLQLACIVAGHVAGLIIAHERALILYRPSKVDDSDEGETLMAKRAVQSQYYMLGVMASLTIFALWLLHQANNA